MTLVKQYNDFLNEAHKGNPKKYKQFWDKGPETQIRRKFGKDYEKSINNRVNLLLTLVDDPDKAEEYAEMDFLSLPNGIATQLVNMDPKEVDVILDDAITMNQMRGESVDEKLSSGDIKKATQAIKDYVKKLGKRANGEIEKVASDIKDMLKWPDTKQKELESYLYKLNKGNSDLIFGESVTSIDEAIANNAKDALRNASDALKQTIPGSKLPKAYVKDYLKSLERMAKRAPQLFVKQYGDFTINDYLEDVRYNMANESVSESFESFVNEAKKYNSSRDSDDIFFLWDDIIDDGRAGISHGQECIGLRCYSRFDFEEEEDLTKFEEEVKKLMKKKRWKYEIDGDTLKIYESLVNEMLDGEKLYKEIKKDRKTKMNSDIDDGSILFYHKDIAKGKAEVNVDGWTGDITIEVPGGPYGSGEWYGDQVENMKDIDKQIKRYIKAEKSGEFKDMGESTNEAKVTGKTIDGLTNKLAKTVKELKDNYEEYKKAKTDSDKKKWTKRAGELTKLKQLVDSELEQAIQSFHKDVEYDEAFEAVLESTIGIKTDRSFKPADLSKALDKAKIKYKMNRLSMTLSVLDLDKKYFQDAKKIVDDLGLNVMMVKESELNEKFAEWEVSFKAMNLSGTKLNPKNVYKVKARGTAEAIKKAAKDAGVKDDMWIATETNSVKKLS